MHLLDHLRDGAKVVSTDGNVFSASAKFYSTETPQKVRSALAPQEWRGALIRGRRLLKKRDK